MPIQLIQKFKQQIRQQAELSVTLEEQLADLFALLETWNQPDADSQGLVPFLTPSRESVADLVTLGDYWLMPAIQRQLIQPLDVEQLSQWQSLPRRWRRLVKRNEQGQFDPNGKFWAAPYRWGSLAIAYRVEEFERLGWTPSDWDDLWRPELQGYLSLLDSARIVLGITSKKLGQSFNGENPTAIPNFETELRNLHRQVKFYSSDAYLQPLLIRDTWVAVGWSTDILPVVERDRHIAAIIPQSGTVLTADLWVRPAHGDQRHRDQPNQEQQAPPAVNPLVAKWIDFCWQDPVAIQLSLLGSAVSPMLMSRDRASLPKALQTNRLLLPNARTLQRSEFLQPLTATAASEYRRLWTGLRQTD
jgi:putative spermidine/putrescine transport system substrate-binding protein